MSSKEMEGLAQNRSRRAYPPYGPCDDVDDEEDPPRLKQESSSIIANRPHAVLWSSNGDGDLRGLRERTRLYLLPNTAIEDTDKQVVQFLVEQWMISHERKGQKIIATVISCCLEAFFSPAGSIRTRAWKFWGEVLDSYDLTIMDRYPCVKHLDLTAVRMRDRLFEAMDDLPLIKKAKAFSKDFSTEVDSAYTLLRIRANQFAHRMAETALGQEYIDQANNDPSKKYAICPDNFTYSSDPKLSYLSKVSPRSSNATSTSTKEHPDLPSRRSNGRAAPPCTFDQNALPVTSPPVAPPLLESEAPSTNAATWTREERNVEFAQATAKSRAKARALAELKVREVDLKIEKLQAERALLELDEDGV